MNRWELLALVVLALLCAAYGAALEVVVPATLTAGIIGAAAFARHRSAGGGSDMVTSTVPLGASAVVQVSADGPEAFLLGEREHESGEPFAFCIGECPSIAMEVTISHVGAGDLDTPSGGRRSTFEIDGQPFVVIHRRAGSFPDEIRSGQALERLRALATRGHPRVTIGGGRMEIRVDGTAEPEAYAELLDFARIVHQLAVEASVAQSTERGVYR